MEPSTTSLVFNWLSLFLSIAAFVISIIVVWSIISIANSNVRIRKNIEYLVDEMRKANDHNGVNGDSQEVKARLYDQSQG